MKMSATTSDSDQKEVELMHEDIKGIKPVDMQRGENDYAEGEIIPEDPFMPQSEYGNKYDKKVRDTGNSKQEEAELETEHQSSVRRITENEKEVTCKNEPDVHKKEEDRMHYENRDVEKTDSRCEPCLFDEIEEQAVAFCTVCIEYLCNSCARDHRRSKMTRSHKVLDENQMPTDSSIFKMMKSMISCPDHQKMDVSYKCEQHEKFICTTCLAVNHRKCEEVKEIPNEPMSFTNGDTGLPLADTLNEVYDTTVSVRLAKEENIKKIHLDRESIIKDQSAFIESLQGHLLELDKKIKEETGSLFKREMEALERDIDECKKIESTESKYKELLDVAVKYGSMVELNVISALTIKHVDLLKDETERQAKIPPIHLAFKENQDFNDISSIGKAFVTKDEKNEDLRDENPGKQNTLENSSDVIDTEESDQVKASRTAETTSQKDNPLMQSAINKTRTMHDLRQWGSEWKCSITSALILLDGRIIVTDCNNQHIKVLNSDFSVKSVHAVNGEPTDMCQTSSNHLAVIFDGKKMIYRYIVREDGLNDDGGFPSKLFPISIGKSQESDNQVVILFSDEKRETPKRSDNDTIEVHIRYVHNGTIVKQLTDFKGKSSHKMVLEDICRIRVIPKQQNTFLISENKKLHCFEIDNGNANTLKESWFYKSHKGSIIDDISDIATDKEGNIYICGKSSRNIHQISGRNFRQNRVLLSVPGIPLSICVDDERRLLIIGCENDDFIYVASFN